MFRSSLRRKREAFTSPQRSKCDRLRRRRMAQPGLAEPSFLRSALDNMTSAVRDEIDANAGAGHIAMIACNGFGQTASWFHRAADDHP